MSELLSKILASPDVAAAIIFCASASIGQVMHAIKKWGDGEVDSLTGWLTNNVRRSVGAAIGNMGGMLVFIQTGVLGPMLALPNGWWAIFLFGFMNGFTADSALNKANREAWTAEKRAEEKQS